MDIEKENLPDIPLSFYCDYICDKCRLNSRCILHAFEKLGKKLNCSTCEDADDYEKIVNDLQGNLKQTLNLVRNSDTMQYQPHYQRIIPPAGTKPESWVVLQLSREFTGKTYDFIKSLRERETIPVKLLIALRDLQQNHTLVTTCLCKAAVALSGSGENGEDAKSTAIEAKESLDKCRSALIEIVGIMPEENEMLFELLNLSGRIEEEIRRQFL